MTKHPAGDAEPREEAEERAAEEFLGRAPAVLPQLTTLELKILRLVAAGETDEEIARILHITCDHVRSCLRDIKLKWAATNRVAMVIIALQNGLINLDELPDLAPTGPAPLTQAEESVLELVAKRLTRPQIASRLKQPYRVVEYIERKIRIKWHVTSRAQLVDLASDYLSAR